MSQDLPTTLPPSPQFVFLFTDIEGSTARWEANRLAMQQALRRHDAIVRAAIESHGGTVFKTVGDAFCAVFGTVGDAIAAAVCAQRDLATQDWKEVDGLLVRMAVALGDADERDGDYFGPVVNRVARLLSAGHGGQVLLSGVAAGAAAGHLPDDAGLRALGMLPLRDVQQPERVFQLTAPGLRATFKPLRALQTPANNLPPQVSSFIGRRHEVAGIVALLRANSLVTILGAGGIGKTRLALEAAGDMLHDLRDGAWFVDLAPLSDPALVASATLSTLHADQAASSSPLDALVAYLKPRELLLVLDNCEHLIAQVAALAAAVVANCPRVTVLATSREPLNVAAERPYRLSSLSDDEAVELFAERARLVAPAFALTAENRTAVEELCRRLDGIALAIELAAARMRAISVEELSRRLQLRLLSGGPRDRQARQRTMRALVDWSYELLSRSEQQLFREVSVFAGGFTLEAAIGVHAADAGDPFDLLDQLTSLVDKSLAIAEQRGASHRYRLLEPIREFARERLAAVGEATSALDRHASFFADAATSAYVEWDAAPAPDWSERYAGELDNLRAALSWTFAGEGDPLVGARLAGGAALVFLRLELLREGVAWSERALTFADRLAPDVCGRITYVLSMLYHNRGANGLALSAAERAVECFRGADDERGLTRALSQVAHHLGDGGERLRTVAQDALRRARALKDERLLAATLQRCAAAYAPNDIATARAYFKEAVDLFRSLGRDDETARVLAWWADAEGVAGNHAATVSIAREALDLCSDRDRLYIVLALASAYNVIGDGERAARAARESLELASKRAHALATALAIFYLAAPACDDEPATVARLLGYARTRLEELQWQLDTSDRIIEKRLSLALGQRLSQDELDALQNAGAAWSEAEASTAALRV